ncbi:MAG TPA: allantoinase AllB [Candidatus Atribacteria bacterium]|nr:allantoinase AllB [Candidatus Atribacteria bacterium]
MKKLDLAIKSDKVFIDGRLIDCCVGVKDGIITTISKEKLDAEKVINAEGKIVLPGTVDPHVHIRAPGHDERETFESGTKDAALGGVTTVIEMPISTPPPYSPEIVERRMNVAKKEVVVDIAFFGAAGTDCLDDIIPCSKSGIVAFKTFLHEAPPGRKEEFIGLTAPNTGDQYELMKKVAQTGVMIGFHTENNDMVNKNIAMLRSEGKTSPIYHGRSRPPVVEIETAAKILLFAEKIGTKVEICHISTPEVVELVNKAKSKGVYAIAETCPHYLFLNENVLNKVGVFAKCNPPLRSEEERLLMWKLVNNGSIDIIGSDHAPYTKEEKERGSEDIFTPPAGFPGLSTRLPLLFTAVKEGKMELDRMVELICENPAKIFGLFPKKGTIALGSDADFVIFDPEKKGVISKDKMFTKCRESALVYNGWEVYGKPEKTIVRGNVVFDNGKITVSPGYGEILKVKRN